jgi:hypothetical protein
MRFPIRRTFAGSTNCSVMWTRAQGGKRAGLGARRSRAGRAILAVVALPLSACGDHVLVARDDGNFSADLDAGELTCGSDVCGPVDLGAGFGEAPPCCYNSECGVLFSSACVEVDSPGVADPTCPPAGSFAGCCRQDGTCGLVATGTAFGCVNPFAFFPSLKLGNCIYEE